MQKLCLLIESLNKEEKDHIVKYYLLKNSFSKRLKLLSMIMMEGVRSDEEACKRLYHSKPNAAFSQLKKRLKEDILNLLLTCDYNNEEPKDFIHAEALATKYVLYGKMLLTRGLTHEAMLLIKKAFKLAEDHEAYEVQALAHAVLKNHSGGMILEEVNELEEQFSKNVDTFYELMNLSLDRRNNRLEPKKRPADASIQEKISVRNKRGCDSLRLRFQSTKHLLDTYIRKRQFERSLELAENILPSIESDSHIITPNQKADFYLNVAKTFLGLERYDKAIQYGEKSTELFSAHEEKKTDGYIIIFKANFYQNKLEQAKEKLQACERLSTIQKRRKCELALFEAYHLFNESENKLSIRALNTFFKHSKLEISLVLNGKLLELLNLLELKDYDWFDYKLENFRKIVNYHTELKTSERFTTIYKAFSSLKKSGYCRKKLNSDPGCTLISKLSDRTSDQHWDPLGTELIPVQRWLSHY